MDSLLIERKRKMNEYFNTSLANFQFYASLFGETSPPYILNYRQLLPELHGNVRQRLGIRIKGWTPNTPASLKFFWYFSTSTIRQIGGKKRENRVYVYIINCQLQYCWFFWSRLQRKGARAPCVLLAKQTYATFCPQFYVHLKVEFQFTCVHASILSPKMAFYIYVTRCYNMLLIWLVCCGKMGQSSVFVVLPIRNGRQSRENIKREVRESSASKLWKSKRAVVFYWNLTGWPKGSESCIHTILDYFYNYLHLHLKTTQRFQAIKGTKTLQLV